MNILNGLVLMGGKSTRMQTDKASLQYHGIPQYEHIYKLIQPFCNQVFLSARSSSYALPTIVDDVKYEEIGPMAGLLSAFDLLPCSWLVVAIDYPLFNSDDVSKLIYERNLSRDATVYFDAETGFYEPFLAIYETSFFINNMHTFRGENYSMQKILGQLKVKKVECLDPNTLKSVDTPDSYKQIKYHLNDNTRNI